MGNEHRDDAADHRTRADDHSSARIGAAAALTIVLRTSCPCPKAGREAFLGDVIVRANAILRPPITTVTVEAGDTLSEIAAAHQLTLNATAVVLGLITRSQVSPTS